MQSNTHLIIDEENEVLVDLPSGKISKKEKRIPIKGQGGVSCILYS